MEKRRKAKIVFSVCFAARRLWRLHPKLENGTAKLLPWELNCTQNLSIKAPELFPVGMSVCVLSQFIFSIIGKMCPKAIAFSPSIISASEKFYRITLLSDSRGNLCRVCPNPLVQPPQSLLNMAFLNWNVNKTMSFFCSTLRKNFILQSKSPGPRSAMWLFSPPPPCLTLCPPPMTLLSDHPTPAIWALLAVSWATPGMLLCWHHFTWPSLTLTHREMTAWLMPPSDSQVSSQWGFPWLSI